ncbi:MAG: (Fe-S)-binding protein [Sulfurimonas sp.]|jgi:glycolate oxidase iron-sulfur subunit|nr:(Fe-S)-binding protein [Sulfurimonas sp.]MBU3940286.1 (Fe-S)-binding protein [bacterium]MBU4025637.1 (Fe-S)-binding protein [bacterium]MBU4059084.1 (Fe-S)-binding protein [bacterium]MBU4111155.1 (Fe-S)-binding protein [bacterium]
MSKKPEEIFNFSETSDACVKCGKCIPVCTIHNVNADEVTSPRGFIDLLGAYHKGNLELDKNAKDIFESCFLCTNCVDVCPKALPTDMIIEQVRSDIAKKFGIAWYKRLFFMLLRHRWLNDLAFKLGYTFQTCGFKIKAEIDSMNSRFNLPMIKTDRLLPSLRKTSFLNSHQENINNGGKRKVAIFIGCLANYNYKDIGEGLLEILEALEIDAFLAKDQKCCSAPAYFTGDFDTVDANAKHNIKYFESFGDEIEAIIVPEATCSAMLKIDYEHFFHDQPEWKERALKIKNKIFMATEWLQNHTHLEHLLASKKKDTKIVTYHDPCHARKMQGIYQEPRNLVRQNYKIVEMSDPNACCGFGGITMQTEKYHFAKAAGVPKAAMIEKTGADIVTAECSACRMQINNSMHGAGVQTVFKNPIELIAEALRK